MRFATIFGSRTQLEVDGPLLAASDPVGTDAAP